MGSDTARLEIKNYGLLGERERTVYDALGSHASSTLLAKKLTKPYKRCLASLGCLELCCALHVDHLVV